MASRKVALVTGGATGIGRSAVLALARAGFDVALNYSSSEAAARETAAEAQKLGVRTLLVRCDVSDESGVRALLKKSQGCVVNTASIVGLRPGPQPLPYAASKAAVVNLTKTLAWNLGPEIRVNAVAPGWMEGDWMQRMLGDKYEDLMGK